MKGHRRWFLDQGFTACVSEPCVFYRCDERGICIAGMYIDDVAWLFSNEKIQEELEGAYCERFKAGFADLTGFLGQQVERDVEHGTSTSACSWRKWASRRRGRRC